MSQRKVTEVDEDPQGSKEEGSGKSVEAVLVQDAKVLTAQTKFFSAGVMALESSEDVVRMLIQDATSDDPDIRDRARKDFFKFTKTIYDISVYASQQGAMSKFMNSMDAPTLLALSKLIQEMKSSGSNSAESPEAE